MAVEKRVTIPMTNEEGQTIEKLALGCSWGMSVTDTMITIVDDNGFYGIGRKTHKEHQKIAVDLDLSCILVNDKGCLCDHLYSPKIKTSLLDDHKLPHGKFDAQNGAFHHSGDDLQGDKDLSGIDIDNEVITMDMSSVDESVSQVIFFLNNSGEGEFGELPYIKVHLNDVNTNKELWSIDVAKLSQSKDNNAIVIGRLKRDKDGWTYSSIEDAFSDDNICETIDRLLTTYSNIDA